ncbi:MAG: DUF5666 domain-containing protein [Acidobacteriota bacterium]
MRRPLARPVLALMAVFLALAVPGFARTVRTLNGTIATVSPATASLKVTTGAGLVTLNVVRSTRLTRNGKAVALPGLAPRDTLRARVDMRSKVVVSLAASGPALVTVRGRVATIDPAGQSLTVSAPGGSRSFVITAQTIVSRNGSISTLGKITQQDIVTVHVAATNSRASSSGSSSSSTATDVEADGPEEANVEGTISAINGTDVTIHPQHGSDVTVHTDSSTTITLDDASATFADLAVGQRAEAEYDPVSFDAFSIHAESAETQHQEVVGTVAAVDTTAMTITINPANGGTAITLNVTSNTQITLDDQTATLDQIVQGDHASAQYDSSMNALQIEASSQGGDPHSSGEVEGIASGASATGLTVTPEHGAAVTVTIDSTTQIELGDNHAGTAADIHDGDRVHVRYDTTTMLAQWIEVQGPETPPPTQAEVEGIASGVSASGLTVTPEEGTAVTLTIDSTTQIELGDGQTGTAADIHDGDRVQARYDTTTMLASRIEVDSGGHH